MKRPECRVVRNLHLICSFNCKKDLILDQTCTGSELSSQMSISMFGCWDNPNVWKPRFRHWWPPRHQSGSPSQWIAQTVPKKGWFYTTQVLRIHAADNLAPRSLGTRIYNVPCRSSLLFGLNGYPLFCRSIWCMYLPHHSEETPQPRPKFIAISKPNQCDDKLLDAIPNECANYTLRVISPVASFDEGPIFGHRLALWS